MRNIILIHADRCVGCRNCMFACSLAHEGLFSFAESRITPVWLEEIAMHIPTLCVQCLDPPCVEICPVEAITRDEETGAMILDPELCIGCKQCLAVCPFGGISMDPESERISICDLCGGEPECVRHCLYGALEWVSLSDAAYLKRRAGAKRLADALE